MYIETGKVKGQMLADNTHVSLTIKNWIDWQTKLKVDMSHIPTVNVFQRNTITFKVFSTDLANLCEHLCLAIINFLVIIYLHIDFILFDILNLRAMKQIKLLSFLPRNAHIILFSCLHFSLKVNPLR